MAWWTSKSIYKVMLSIIITLYIFLSFYLCFIKLAVSVISKHRVSQKKLLVSVPKISQSLTKLILLLLN